MNTAAASAVPPTNNRFHQFLTHPRSRLILLQCLVSVILSYELLFGTESVISRVHSDGMIVGMWAFVSMLVLLPSVWFELAWVNGALVAVDTVLVTGTIYLSGNARPDLYTAYFIVMLVAASVRRLSHRMGLCLFLCVGYAALLYEGIVLSETVAVGHLLGVPVLLVMAVFYGLALETVTVVQEEKSTLLKDIESLKRTEEQLAVSKVQLEARIAGLNKDLTQSQDKLQQGLAVRQGLERRLREAQKMEAVGRMAAGIAKEFGELFVVIGKQTGVLLAQLPSNDPLRVATDEIFTTGEKAAALTAQLIALNLEEGQVRQVLSVQTVLADLQGAIKSVLPGQIDLAIHQDESPIYAEVDREGLEKVLLQLVVNARDAMPNGGQLVIEARSGAGLPGATHASGIGKKPAHDVLVQISDTGTGMNLDTQARMFEPFFSTKETNIGLGLTAVYGIVKQNGGMVEVDSRPGQGTVVRVWLPGARAVTAHEEPVPKSTQAKGDETILLVEEDEIRRKLVGSTLVRHKYRVLEAASSVEALMLTQRYQGVVHLTVSPLVMTEIGGRELARRLLNHHPAMKALFVSSYDDETIAHHRINRRWVLQHPYRQVGLVEKVREMLDAA
ncbi:ATP-binding protein [Nitrospira lenta]|uniref:histidine kinase n=1 Tax=Nitrospira lenta TaxID=1436998 RepID=A0A330L577_9BACT|nr:ATP-binding protein [Nitrospira lenta]SPP64988.1 putative Hybrid histidine kinase [Nitrospira lenta]